MNASDCDILLETQLSSHDPTAPARLFTVLQGLLTPTAQRSPRNVVYLHRGINPSKRLFFQALCAALGRSNTSYRSGCGWVTSENIDDAARILNSGPTGRYPQLLILDGIPSGTLVAWRHLMSLAAMPAVQIHILQDIAWPHEPLRLPTAIVEQYDWRDLSSDAVSLRADAVDVLAPAIAAWLGIVGGAHPPDTHLCAEVVAAPAIVPATPETAPSARSPRRGLLGATPALWSLDGACEPGETFSAPSTASSADTTPIGQAPSAVSPSAATWPQESQSAATATQPGSTRSSAETVQPSGESTAPSRTTKRIPRGPLDELAQRAATTAVYPGAGTGDLTAQLYTALALAGEAGEVAGKASKVLRDGESSALMAALYAELGDVLWHWLQCCAEWGAQPDQVAEAMFARLQDRQARGKLRGSGDER